MNNGKSNHNFIINKKPKLVIVICPLFYYQGPVLFLSLLLTSAKPYEQFDPEKDEQVTGIFPDGRGLSGKKLSGGGVFRPKFIKEEKDHLLGVLVGVVGVYSGGIEPSLKGLRPSQAAFTERQLLLRQSSSQRVEQGVHNRDKGAEC